MILWILGISCVLVWALKRFLDGYKYWERRGIKQAGTIFHIQKYFDVMVQRRPISDIALDVYNMFPNERYSGSFDVNRPNLILRDPDLIKQIAVKDFDHFVNHQAFIPEDGDPLWANNLFALKDQRWRDMRATLSPAFTASKMKYIFTLIEDTTKQFSNHFKDRKEEIITIEMKDTFTKFANDVIANTAFGIQCDSLKHPDNEFFVTGLEINNTSFLIMLKFTFIMLFPRISKYFALGFFNKRISNFFINIVRENIESREKHHIVRPDLINLLIEARKNNGIIPDQDQEMTENDDNHNGKANKKNVRLTDVDITAQALIFFFAGFETVSGLMSFMAHELAVNPDVQEKLRQEVDDVNSIQDGKLTYEALQGMKYLDMVVSETLRKWPITPGQDRICNKEYKIDAKLPHEQPLTLEKDLMVFIPIYGLHRDPQYFPDPDRFDPERFSDENKGKIQPYTYLPFGIGPRSCIGNRFAMLEVKALFFNILRDFEIVPVEKTEIPLTLSSMSFNMMANNGFWLGLKKRNINKS